MDALGTSGSSIHLSGVFNSPGGRSLISDEHVQERSRAFKENTIQPSAGNKSGLVAGCFNCVPIITDTRHLNKDLNPSMPSGSTSLDPPLQRTARMGITITATPVPR